MTDVATLLRQGGNGLSPLGLVDELVHACQMTGLEVAAGAALTANETWGQNIWGHDGVDTGGCYTKGGPVTPQNYGCVKASPTAGYNGVGPVQLTWKGYWAAADAMAGCWDPLSNYRVGFQALIDLQRQHGEQDGARAYNGAGPDAVAYGARWLQRRDAYRSLLAGSAQPGPVAAPAPAVGRPVLSEGDVSALTWQLQQFMNRVFPSYSHIDAGPGPTSRLGPQTVAVLTEFQKRSNIPTAPPFAIGPRTWAALASVGFR